MRVLTAKLEGQEALRKHRHAFTVCFKNVHSSEAMNVLQIQ